MRYTPEYLGRLRVGWFLDAMKGYNEAESERVKSLAEIVRKSTWLLWNIQVGAAEKATSPSDLWRFPWDVNEKGTALTISDEEKKRIEDTHEAILKDM